MRYFRRLFNLVLFLFLWIGMAWFLVKITEDEGAWGSLLITWLPSLILVAYLDSDEE